MGDEMDDLILLQRYAEPTLLAIECGFCRREQPHYIAVEDIRENDAYALAVKAVSAGWRAHPLDGSPMCRQCYAKIARCCECKRTPDDFDEGDEPGWQFIEGGDGEILCGDCWDALGADDDEPERDYSDQDDAETQQQEFYGTYYDRPEP